MNETQHDYSNTIIDKRTALESYGTEAQKNFFNKHKKLNADNERGLLYTLDQHYDVVERIKVGRAFHYSLGKKREVVAIRQDARMFNGLNQANAVEYSKSLDILVANYIDSREYTKVNMAKTFKSWLAEMQIISLRLSSIMNSRYNANARDFFFELLTHANVISGVNEYHIVDEYLSMTDELATQLERSLKRLEKTRAITLEKVYKKKVNRYHPDVDDEDAPIGKIEESPENWVTVSEDAYFQAKQVDKSLRSKYKITPWQAHNLKHLTPVKKYLKEKEETAYVEVGVDGVKMIDQFYYVTYRIIKNTEDSVLEDYLRSYHPDDFALIQDDDGRDEMINHHLWKYRKSRQERVAEKMGNEIQQKFDANTKGMERLGHKKSRLYNPKRFNEIISGLQDKDIEWIIEEEENTDDERDEY